MIDRPTRSRNLQRLARCWAARSAPARGRARHALGLLVSALGCAREVTTEPTLGAQPSPALERPASRVRIPGGAFAAGTEPGRFERDPSIEPRLGRIALGPFEIDAEPYPGGTAAPLVGLDRHQALERCIERGGRLCSELEWERVCKGPDQHPFPSGPDLDASCRHPPGCASGFGVRGMASAREWTASDAPRRGELLAVVRGAAAGAPDPLHRCAHRELSGGSGEADILFRCCYGPPNAARVSPPRLGRAFADAELPEGELTGLLASAAPTRGIASEVAYFESAAARASVLAQGEADARGRTLTAAPLAWNPAPGVELLIVTGRSGRTTSFVVAFDVLGDGSRRLASSFIMLDEPGPVVLAYEPSQRASLEFSTCWDCLGETGRILYRDPDETIIVQP